MKKLWLLGLLLAALVVSGCGGGSGKLDDATVAGNRANQFLTDFVQADVSSVQHYFASQVYWTVTYIDLWENVTRRTYLYAPYQCQEDYAGYKEGIDYRRYVDPDTRIWLSWDRTVVLTDGTAIVTGVVDYSMRYLGQTVADECPVTIKLVKSGSTWLINEVDWGTLLVYREIVGSATTKQLGVPNDFLTRQ